MKKFLSLLTAALVISACSQEVQPKIAFLGIGEGNNQSDITKITFQESFEVTQHELIAVVGFATVEDGTTVEATWFSPDDRAMPLGRTNVVTESGATIARFTLASRVDWEPSPYLLQIRAMKGEGEDMKTATGSLQFYIGMSEKEIADYKADYAAWQLSMKEVSEADQKIQQRENELMEQAKDELGSDAVELLNNTNLVGDAELEYFYGEREGLPPVPPTATPSTALETSLNQFILLSGSGVELASLTGNSNKNLKVNDESIYSFRSDAEITVSVLTTGTWVLSWMENGKPCSVEVRKEGDNYAAQEKVCLP